MNQRRQSANARRFGLVGWWSGKKPLDAFCLLLMFGVQLVTASSLYAQTFTADLELQMEELSSPPYVQGDSWMLAAGIINHGPDPTDGFVLASAAVPASMFSIGAATCNHGLQTFPFGGAAWVINYPPLMPGDSHTCRVTLVVEETTPLATEWIAAVGHTFWVDPDRTNNRSDLFFDPNGAPAQIIQIPILSGTGIWMLAALMAVIGLILLGFHRGCPK